TQERTRHWQRLEKLLEDALIKVSSVACKLDTLSTRDMSEALIRGERDPQVLAELARGRMRGKRAARIEAVIAVIPAAGVPTTDGDDHDAGEVASRARLTAIERLDEIPGISPLG